MSLKVGNMDLPDGMISYGDRLANLAKECGEADALVFLAADGSNEHFSWRHLEERSNALAWKLTGEGVGVGDRLGIKIRNSPDHILVALAAWKIGAVPIPIRWDLPEWELDRVLAVLDAKKVVEKGHQILELGPECRIDPYHSEISPHASGVMSSGSTGLPKVILRLVPGVYVPGSSSNRLVEAYGTLGPQMVLVPAPLYHSNGFMALGNLLEGDRLLLLERFDAGLLLGGVEDHGVTGMVATTVMLQRLARHEDFGKRDLSSLDWVMHGAAPLPDWLAKRWIERISPEKFFVCYGSSEGIGATFARGDEYLEHPLTVGRGAMGTDVRILGETGEALPTGEIGQIYMKSEHGILATYVGDVPPIPVTEDGYSTVGDLGWRDSDGYLYIADRRVDMIVTGGANVYPAEVEAALSEHPSVADVVVIGLSDPEWGRRVHAIVQLEKDVLGPSADELIDYAGDRLARYKTPKSVELVTEIPRSEATKVNRSALVAAREVAPE